MTLICLPFMNKQNAANATNKQTKKVKARKMDTIYYQNPEVIAKIDSCTTKFLQFARLRVGKAATIVKQVWRKCRQSQN